jgi:hypothetical protein
MNLPETRKIFHELWALYLWSSSHFARISSHPPLKTVCTCPSLPEGKQPDATEAEAQCCVLGRTWSQAFGGLKQAALPCSFQKL